MVLQRASLEDYDSIIAFYDDVIERTPEIEKHARWQHGKHPTADGIKSYVNEGYMYLYKEQDTIVGGDGPYNVSGRGLPCHRMVPAGSGR